MGTVTVNFEGVDAGAVYELADVGHVVNGFVNDFPDRDDDIVLGSPPGSPLPVLTEADRLAATIEQLERDAESYRASEGAGTDERAAELDALVAEHRTKMPAA